MNIITLQAKTREEKGRATDALRAESLVPAVVYGVDTEPQSITVDQNSFVKTYKQAGESSIIELKVDEKKILHVLIQDYQLNALTDDVMHIDFRSVDMSKPIDAVVDLEFIGDAPAVKALGGTLMRTRDSLSINCLPKDLVRTIHVDLTKLATFDDVIHVSDLDIPEGITVEEDEALTIASVAEPRTEEEMDALDETIEGDVAAIAVEGEEEGEEGSDEEGGSEEKSE